MKLVALLSLFTVCSAVSTKEESIVQLPFGNIRGQHQDGYYSFQNIPYAEPPVGSLRFEPPIPLNKSWNGVKDGTQAIIGCVEFVKDTSVSGSEDCLYVHVVTPSITCEQSYPVRVHIHGGAFMSGSPGYTDTSILVKRGMVVVTMGYRLGPLGFLSSGDGQIAGNMGLKDQRVAMKWTKANIESFCGDPNKITLSGVSAGGSAAHFHLLQKFTENYVNAVASHNGVATCPWVFEPNPKGSYSQFADELSCPTEGRKACLQSKPIDDIIRATLALQSYFGNPFTVFAPVVEPPDSLDPFMTEHPEEIMKNGRAANVSWLVAYADREGSCIAANFLKPDENGTPEINNLNARWTEVAPILFFFNHTTPIGDWKQYSDFLKNKYLGEKEFSEQNYRLLENTYSDVLFNNDMEKAIDMHRKYNPGQVYVYYYRYPHKYGLGNLLLSRTDISFGADHLADTIFTIPLIPLKQTSLSERDKKVAEMLLDMYSTWANTGILSFGGVDLPLNTPTAEGRLTINENCFSIDGCLDESVGCNCLNYD